MECLNCKKEFTPQRKSAKFCSDLCRAGFHQNLKLAKKQADRILEGLKEVEIIDKTSKAQKLFDELLKELGSPETKIKSAKVAKKEGKTIAEINVEVEDAPKPNTKSYSDFDFAIRTTSSRSELRNILSELRGNTSIDGKKKSDLELRIETRMRYSSVE